MNDLTVHPLPPAARLGNAEQVVLLDRILGRGELNAVFQPIVSMDNGTSYGFEGLIRGPAGTLLSAPDALFGVASRNGRLVELEEACRQTVIRAFVEQEIQGKLFLNVSPQVLLLPGHRKGQTLNLLRDSGLRPEQVVIELTENHPIPDYAVLHDAAFHYREMGFEFAVDDLGEGFSSLRLWSELHPDYVKIDKHFTRSISMDPVRQHFIRSIQALADVTGARVVAEGIESHADLITLWELGVTFGQGFYLARPEKSPEACLPENIGAAMRGYWQRTGRSRCLQHAVDKKIWRQALQKPPHVGEATPLSEVYGIFKKSPGLHALPVFADGRAVGLIGRDTVQMLLAAPLGGSAHGEAPCARYMDASPLIVDAGDSIEEIGNWLASRNEQQAAGFLVTRDGHYAGVGSAHALLREIIHVRVNESRYSNPLTSLPGNVPTNEFIDRLLGMKRRFHAWYCDLSHLKCFNDAFGYRRGDEILLLTAQILSEVCDRETDFAGHLGGDDFVMVMRSRDPKQRCLRALAAFEDGLRHLLRQEEIARNGYEAEDRKRKTAFHPLPSLAIGGAQIDPARFRHHSEVFDLISAARKRAKQKGGNALHVARQTKPMK